MSTVRKPHADPPAPQSEDPFRYGWRYVRRPGANGREEHVQVPLTLEDVLHPQEGDFIVDNQAHADDCIYLRGAFEAQLADDPHAVVLFDCRVAWDVPGVKPMGPDVAVVFGVRQRRRWPTFYCAKEGSRPELVIEVTSPDTRKTDLEAKRRLYYQARIPIYVILDEEREVEPRPLRLLAFRRGTRGYVNAPLDKKGRFWLEAVHLWLGIEEGRAVCYNRRGQRIGDYTEVSQARAAAEKKAAKESHRAEAAEAQLRALEKELRRLRGETSP
jgi:hypothetical protein